MPPFLVLKDTVNTQSLHNPAMLFMFLRPLSHPDQASIFQIEEESYLVDPTTEAIPYL